MAMTGSPTDPETLAFLERMGVPTPTGGWAAQPTNSQATIMPINTGMTGIAAPQQNLLGTDQQFWSMFPNSPQNPYGGYVESAQGNPATNGQPLDPYTDLITRLSGYAGGYDKPLTLEQLQQEPTYQQFAQLAQQAGYTPEQLLASRAGNISGYQKGGIASQIGNKLDETGLSKVLTYAPILAGIAGGVTAFMPGFGVGGAAPAGGATAGGTGAAAGAAGETLPAWLTQGASLTGTGAGGFSVAPGALAAGTGIPASVAGGLGGFAPLGAGAGIVAGAGGAGGNVATGFGGKILGAIDRLGGGGGDLLSKVLGGVTLAGGIGKATGGNAISDLLGLTNRDLESQIRTAEYRPQDVSLPGGLGASYDPATGYSSTLGDLDPLRQTLIGSINTSGLDPQVAAALKQYGLGSFGGTGELEAQRLAQLRQQAAPQEEQLLNRLNQNLFTRGRLGIDEGGGGTQESYRGLARGLAEADITRQIAAGDYAQKAQAQRFGQGYDALSLLDAMRTGGVNRQVAGSGAVGDITRLSALPYDIQLAQEAARTNAQLGVGTEARQYAASQPNFADLLARFMASRSV